MSWRSGPRRRRGPARRVGLGAQPLDEQVQQRAQEQQQLADDLADLLPEVVGDRVAQRAQDADQGADLVRGGRAGPGPCGGAVGISSASRSRRLAACRAGGRADRRARLGSGSASGIEGDGQRAVLEGGAGGLEVVERGRQQQGALVPVHARRSARARALERQVAALGERQLQAQRRAVGAELQALGDRGGAARAATAPRSANSASPRRSSIAGADDLLARSTAPAAPARARTRRAPRSSCSCWRARHGPK